MLTTKLNQLLKTITTIPKSLQASDRPLHRLQIKNRHSAARFYWERPIISTITTRRMETVDILPLLDQLDDDIDDVEEVIDSVLPKSLTETSQKLPVLDKAKFHIGIVYALETLIFCMN